MSESKIQFRVGNIEFMGEGGDEWLASQLDKVLSKIPDLLMVDLQLGKSSNNTTGEQDKVSSKNPNSAINLSMVNVATKLGSKTGADLTFAAGAYLRFVKQQSSFTRDDLLQAMKDATGIYKSSYSANLSNILLGLVRNGRLTQSSANGYSLHIEKETSVNGILSK